MAFRAPKYPRVYVVWTDHTEHMGWVDVKAVTGELPICYSIGWVVEETPDHIILAPHLATDEDGNTDTTGAMQIAKVNIKKRMSFRYTLK